MVAQVYLWGVRILTWLSSLVWLIILVMIDPEASQWVGLVLFYSSLFLALAGWFILFFNWLRKIFLGENEGLKKIGMSSREGILFSLMVAVVLFLQAQSILTWWIMAILVAGFFLWELYFLWRV